MAQEFREGLVQRTSYGGRVERSTSWSTIRYLLAEVLPPSPFTVTVTVTVMVTVTVAVTVAVSVTAMVPVTATVTVTCLPSCSC